MASIHVPILVEPIVNTLIAPFQSLKPGSPPHWFVDCTFGGGGHTSAFLETLKQNPDLSRHKILAVDQDQSALDQGKQRFHEEVATGKIEFFHGRMSELGPVVESRPVLGILADLGFSSDQLEDPARGLSFNREGPLDMRLDPTRGLSCRDFLAQVTEKELIHILKEYGEERFAPRIAAAILHSRREKKLPQSTQELSQLVVRATPPSSRHGRIHAATRTFQALRIVVNEEMEELDSLLDRVILGLRPGGRVAILSFHSLEDRKVKRAFRNSESFLNLTKKPLEASDEEIKKNPRARSAKLRFAERMAVGGLK